MKKALLVIDMQNDYLYEKRMPIFAYDTEKLVGLVNETIREYRDNGDDVIYIRHIIQNLWTNRKLFGYSIAGTEGAEIYGGIDIVSDYCFDKYVGNAFSNKNLKKLAEEKGYDTIDLCGLDECGCVTSTALGTAKLGLTPRIIRKATATVFPEKKVAAAHKKLDAVSVQFI